MKELIDNLNKLIEEAKLQAVSRKPDEERDPAYLFGYYQGKYTGLNEALKAVENFLDGKNREEEYK